MATHLPPWRKPGGLRRALSLLALLAPLAVAAGCGTASAQPTVSSTASSTTTSSTVSPTSSTAPLPATTAPPTTATTTTTTTTPSSTTTTVATPPSTTQPVQSTPPPPTAALAVGDSVMVDYEQELQRDLPGVTVDAVVGEQFSTGLEHIEALAAAHDVPPVVIVALGTNGPITPAALAAMMEALSGARRVVLVTDHVDRPWQDPNNELLRGAPAKYANAAVADWQALAAGHPDWFYADGTHLPIDGPGASALAALIAATAKR